MTGLHTICRRVNCSGIICHLFITQAISPALFIFQQDPRYVLIILNADWQCCVTTTFKWKASRKLARLCWVLQMLKQIKKLPMCKYHWHFNEKEMFTWSPPPFFIYKRIAKWQQNGQPCFWGMLDCCACRLWYVHATQQGRSILLISNPFLSEEEERVRITERREGILS